MSLEIAGLGTAVPGDPVSQERAAEVAPRLFEKSRERARMLGTLYRWTRVRSRHSVLSDDTAGGPGSHQAFFPSFDGEQDGGPTTAERMKLYERHAAPLAIEASAVALERAEIPPDSITHLVTVSCSGFSAPGFDIATIKALGLTQEVARSHVGFMGCHGAMNGLRLARSFIEADPEARVLLCAVELCTLHASYGWDPERIVANALFSDGAAALVGTSPSGSPTAWSLDANGSHLVADSEDAMTWNVRDHGFEMTLSPRVPDLIKTHARPWLESWLGKHGLTIPAIASWAVHPGGPRILDALARTLEIDRTRLATSYEVLERFGNMSSPTVLFLLDRLQRDKAPKPVVALGFGPGLAIEAALIR